jgi:hypothetical protein
VLNKLVYPVKPTGVNLIAGDFRGFQSPQALISSQSPHKALLNAIILN